MPSNMRLAFVAVNFSHANFSAAIEYPNSYEVQHYNSDNILVFATCNLDGGP